MSKYDVFISHATEDKDSIVRQLASNLHRFGVKVWYDEFTLKVGDSLSRSIDDGLLKSNYGLVIISPNFINKPWPEYELRGLISKEIGNKKVIIPVWHNVSKEEVLKFSPFLADKFAIVTLNKNINKITLEIIKAVKPDLFTSIMRKIMYDILLANSDTKIINRSELKISPIKHKRLPTRLINRLRLIRAALLDVNPNSLDSWLDGFKRDANPLREIEIWENITSSYLEYHFHYKNDNIEIKKLILLILILISNGVRENKLVKEYTKHISQERIHILSLLMKGKSPF